jgi:hypothetical protein
MTTTYSTTPSITTTPLYGNYNNDDILFERKIEIITEGLTPQYFKCLYNKVSKGNALAIVNYITSMKTEINLSDHYKSDVIKLLSIFSIFFNNQRKT